MLINLRAPSTITEPQLNSNENGLLDGGRLLVTSQVNTPKNHRKNTVDRTGPRVPREGIHPLGGIPIMINTAINTPIRASPAIKPADNSVPRLISSLPDVTADCDGSPFNVPSTLRWVVRVTK